MTSDNMGGVVVTGAARGIGLAKPENRRTAA